MSGNRPSLISKRIIAYVCAVILSMCLWSCLKGGIRRNMVVADSLAEADQTAAISYIDSVAHARPEFSRADRMKLLLLKTKALNKLDCRLNPDTLAGLVTYFDHHGSANDRMLAYYILGCYYMDHDNTPETMRYFHHAAEAADTTASDCDYRTLHKVHVLTAELLLGQNAITDAMEENVMAYKYALQAKDSFNAVITLEQRAKIYLSQGHEDKAFDIRSKLYGMYMRLGRPKEAAISLWPLAELMNRRNDLAGAKRCLDDFEKKSGLIDRQGNIEHERESYYIDKGTYLAKAGKTDSAEYYFRKCISNTKDAEDLCNSLVGLADVYKRRRDPDSVAKYAELARITTDSMYAGMNTTHLQEMRAMYDYHGYKLSAEVYKRKAVTARLTNVIILLVVLMLAVGGALYIIRKRRARRQEIQRLERSISELEQSREELANLYEHQRAETARLIEDTTAETAHQETADDAGRHDLEKKEQAKDELRDLSERQKDRFKSLIEKKDAQISRLYEEMQRYEKSGAIADNTTLYAGKPIVIRLRLRARKDLTPMTKEELALLKTLLADDEPFSRIESLVSDNEYRVCMLVRVGFLPSDICILTGLSHSNVSNIRKRLLTKLTGRNGSPKDFDKYISSL